MSRNILILFLFIFLSSCDSNNLNFNNNENTLDSQNNYKSSIKQSRSITNDGSSFDNAKIIYPSVCVYGDNNCKTVVTDGNIQSKGSYNYYKMAIAQGSIINIYSTGKMYLSCLMFDENHGYNLKKWIANGVKYDSIGNFSIEKEILTTGIYYFVISQYYNNAIGKYQLNVKIQNKEGIITFCGDLQCNSDENCDTCEQDCPVVCGDGQCCSSENSLSCIEDCPSVCGDGLCSGDENCLSCISDCPSVCGDNICFNDENSKTCLVDCPSTCGDGFCTGDENCLSCIKDCPSVCGDNLCCADENSNTCLVDCPTVCGDNKCEGNEDCLSCPDDCQTSCGDGLCCHDENSSNCLNDCPSFCGDSYCTESETKVNCPVDCKPVCGDGICTGDETCENCINDCPVRCGDRICSIYENCEICAVDCLTGCEYLNRPDYGNSFSEAASIYPTVCTSDDIDCKETVKKGKIEYVGHKNFYKLPLNEGSELTFYTKGTMKLSGLFYNENHQNSLRNWIKSADLYDSYGNIHLTITDIEPGTYFFVVSHYYESKKGDYTLYVKLVNKYGINLYCGDWLCNLNETSITCPGDCPAICGDSYCSEGENSANCVIDCPSVCGDKECAQDENCLNCILDCPITCGDGICSENAESPANCIADCPAVCGDNICSAGENCITCSQDCTSTCGDGFCCEGENCIKCLNDCQSFCGDGICFYGETYGLCPVDCPGRFTDTIYSIEGKHYGYNSGSDILKVGKDQYDFNKYWQSAVKFIRPNVSVVDNAILTLTPVDLSYLIDDNENIYENALNPDAPRNSILEIDNFIHDNLFYYDINGDNVISTFTDGILILRYLFKINQSNELLKNYNGIKVITNNSIRNYIKAIKNYIEAGIIHENGNLFDIDLNGEEDALTDGLLISRYIYDSINVYASDTNFDNITDYNNTFPELYSNFRLNASNQGKPVKLDITNVFNEMISYETKTLIFNREGHYLGPRLIEPDLKIEYQAYPKCGDDCCNGDETGYSCPDDCNTGKIYSISFNFDPNSYDKDAINVRYDKNTPVLIPEWKAKQQSQDVVYIRNINPVLKVKIQIFEVKPYDRVINITAVKKTESDFPDPVETSFFLGAYESISDEIEIKLNGSTGNCFSKYSFTWVWLKNGNELLSETSHNIYVLLDYPYRLPSWNPENIYGNDKGELPWTRGLSWIAKHADKVTNMNDLISSITTGWYDTISTDHYYSYNPQFSSTYKNMGDALDFTSMLDRLENGADVNDPRNINCYDAANSIILLANLAGAKAWGIHLNSIHTNELLFIGNSIPKKYPFENHHLVVLYNNDTYDDINAEISRHPDNSPALIPAKAWDASYKLDFDGDPWEHDPEHDYNYAIDLDFKQYCKLAFYYGTSGILDLEQLRGGSWGFSYRTYIIEKNNQE